jgi:hypothetical protein
MFLLQDAKVYQNTDNFGARFRKICQSYDVQQQNSKLCYFSIVKGGQK